MKVAITGHRPNKLWGYDYNTPNYHQLGRLIRKFLIENEVTHFITGMALGVDTIGALVVLKLKEDGRDIQLICAVPCANHTARWQESSTKLHNYILSRADQVVQLQDTPYDNKCMQKRNEWMVDNADALLAVWDGSSGGTKNCLEYAKKQRPIPVTLIKPKDCVVSA